MTCTHSSPLRGWLATLTRFKRCHLTASLLPFLFFLAGSLQAATVICPTTIENDPPATADACGVVLNVGPDRQVSATATGTRAYNGSDSTFGITNNSGRVITSLFLRGGDITNFSLNGITTYVSANGVPIPRTPNLVYGYETYYGPSTIFSAVDRLNNSLLVTFLGGLLPGASTYFSLAGDPTTNVNGLTGPNGALTANVAAVPEPSTWALFLAGAVLIGAGRLQKLACRPAATVARTLRQPRVQRLAAIVGALVGSLLFASAAKAATVVTLPSSPKPEQVASAREALKNGAVVAMNNADPAAFASYFHVHVPGTKKNPEIPLRYCVIATHRKPNGRMHTYVGPRVMPGVSNLSACTADLQKWADQNVPDGLKANSGVRKADDGPSSPPPAAAWVELSTTTLNSTDSHGNFMQETVGVYRGASSNTAIDYYLVTKQMQTGAHLEHCVDGGGCGWYPHKRGENFAIDAPGAVIVDHGPLSANNTSTAGFSVGADASKDFSVSAEYSQEWDQEDVSTQDRTDPRTAYAAWEDAFSFGGRNSYTHAPNAIKKPWQNNQAVIYTVPAGTTAFSISVADWFHVYYDNGFQNTETYVYLDAFINVSPPALSVAPKSLFVVPGQAQTFELGADIPTTSGEQLQWTITNVPVNMTVSALSGAGRKIITVQVPAGTPSGLAGILNINADPAYGAPEVRGGPLQLPITVVSPSDVKPGVLISGGLNSEQQGSDTAEMWNPATGQSTTVGNMTQARAFHTATPLDDGRILLAGGLDHDQSLTGTTEFYTPAAQSFSPGPGLAAPRAYHTASLLADGTVLFTGGQDDQGNALATAELYNPADNTRAFVGSMSTGRMKHAATVLPNNTVLISGGVAKYDGTGPVDTAEIYNPNTKSFSPAIGINYGVFNHSAVATSTLLTTGQVLAAYGQSQPQSFAIPQVVRYTPGSHFYPLVTGSRQENELVNTPAPALIALPGGSALLLGEDALNSSSAHGFGQLFDLNSGIFSGHYTMQENRDLPVGVLIKNTGTQQDGKVVVAGGVMPNTGSTNGTAIEVFDPAQTTWTTAGSLTASRRGHTMTLVGAATSTSTTSLTSSLNPSITGQTVVFTATVTTPGVYVTGTVTFMDGATALSTVSVDGGTAQFSTTALSIGTHPITAVYSGNSFFRASTSPQVAQVVNPIQVTPTFQPLTPSQSITYGTASISLAGTLSTGSVYPPQNGLVSVVIQGVAQNATIGGSGTFSISNFPTASIPVGQWQIQYSYAGDAQLRSATNADTSLTVNPVTPVFRDLTAPAPIAAGTASVTLGGTIAAGNLIPGGTVSITVNGAVTPATIGTDGTFSASVNTSALAAGTYPVIYAYAAAGNFGAVSDSSKTLTVQSVATTTTLTATPNPSAVGQGVTFTATVAGANGTPAGTVTFYDNGAQLGVGTLTNGSAIYSTDALTAGAHSITVSYAGGGGFAASTSAAVTQTVNKATPAFSGLTASQTIGYYTANVTLSGSVAAGSTFPASGEQVSIAVGTATQNATIGPNGSFTASVPTRSLAAGSYPVTYSYAGNANLSAATNVSTTLTVGKITPVLDNLTPPQTITAGTPSINLAGKISQSGAIPTGVVSITIGAFTQDAPIQPDGSFSLTFKTADIPAAADWYRIVYQYVGDANFNANGDGRTTLQVRAAATTTAVASSANPSVAGQAVTFTATVSGAGGTPTGSVTFNDGTTALGTVALNQGTATLTTSTLAVGPHSITAVYAGGANFSGSTSAALTQTVNKLTPVFSGITASQSITAGTASISLSGRIAAGASIPTGSVSITINGASTSAAIGADGSFSASVNTAAIPASATPYPIAYGYNGDAGFNAATNASTTLTVQTMASTTVLASSANPSVAGQSVTFTATVSGAGGTPTGSVTFNDGTTALGTVALTQGTAQFTTATLAVGPHAITAVYSGGPAFATSQGALTQTVNPALVTPAFSNLNPSLAAPYGTPAIAISGVLSAAGPVYPPVNSVVTITIGGVTTNATVGPNGTFLSTNVAVGTLAAGSYPITYGYAGDSRLTAASNTATSLLVTKQTPVFGNLTASQTIAAGTASVSLSGRIIAGTLVPPGQVSITINSVSTGAAINPDGSFSASVNTAALPAATTPYVITYGYTASANFNAASNATTALTVVASGPGATTTTITASVQRCVSGTPFQFFITVKPASGSQVPSGRVFLTRQNPDGTSAPPLIDYLNASGQWNPDINGINDSIPAGTYTFVARYEGTGNYQVSTGQLQMTCTAP